MPNRNTTKLTRANLRKKALERSESDSSDSENSENNIILSEENNPIKVRDSEIKDVIDTEINRRENQLINDIYDNTQKETTKSYAEILKAPEPISNDNDNEGNFEKVSRKKRPFATKKMVDNIISEKELTLEEYSKILEKLFPNQISDIKIMKRGGYSCYNQRSSIQS